ncbi:MAG: DUF2149 domain-containing protein [Methanobacterium sp.]|nr:DUF2149 domain-containing protein [Methanobacterium sp.]
MMSKKRKFLDDDGEDPTSGIINMTDCMLVLAVGFLVFAIIALQSNPSLISSTQGPTQNTVSVSTGETLNDTPNNESGSGSGYQQMGTVYKDPDTGKLILVS